MSGDPQYVREVFETIADGYDQANDRISFGMHKRWKKLLVGEIGAFCPQGKALDVCCGSGDVALAVTEAYPQMRVTGLDFSPHMLELARKRGQGRVEFVQGDALALPFEDNSFDVVTISFGLRNTADYAQAVGELARVCAPGGRIWCLDSSQPEFFINRILFRAYFGIIMPLWGGGFKKWRQYRWLHRSTADFVSKGELKELFESQGLKEVTVQSLSFGAAVLCGGVKPGA